MLSLLAALTSEAVVEAVGREEPGLPLAYTVVVVSVIAIVLAVVGYKLSRPTAPGPYLQIPAYTAGPAAHKIKLRPVLGYWHTYLWGRGEAEPVDEEATRHVADLLLDVKTFHRARK